MDHHILLSRLEQCVCIKGTAQKWFQSYLSDRTFSVHLGQYSSTVALLSCGVPQGSILGPLLFSLYMLPLGSIFRRHNISFHCFADDVQFYLPIKICSKDSLQPLLNCLKDIKTWRDLNFLNSNDNKTELILFGRPDQVKDLDDILGPLASYNGSHIKNLGVILDSSFKLNKQIRSIVKTHRHTHTQTHTYVTVTV